VRLAGERSFLSYVSAVPHVVAVLVVASLLSCVTAAVAAPPVSAGGAAQLDTAQAAQARLRLGHYSSGDGLTGLVLDRTGSPVKLRVDGRPEIFALLPSGPPSGAFSTTRLENGLGRTMIEVDESGSVRYFADGQGQGVAMFRDGAAGQLPDPPPAPFAAPRTIGEWNTKLREQCGTDIVFDVDLAGMKGDDETLRNAHWQMARVADVLTRTCRDAIGKAAVRAKLKSIRVRNVAASSARTTHEGSALVLDQPFATSKGATLREIAAVLNGWL